MPSLTPLNQLLRVDTIVAGGLVVTMDEQRRVLADGAVAIAAGQIVAVGKMRPSCVVALAWASPS